MYDPKEIPEMPSDEQIGDAVSVLIALTMQSGGMLSGVVERTPLPDAETTAVRYFHFDMHDATLCADHALDNIKVGTLQ